MAPQLSWLERRANNAKVMGSIPLGANKFFWQKKSMFYLCVKIVEKFSSPTGNRTRAFHVTGGDPHHQTIEDLLGKVQFKGGVKTIICEVYNEISFFFLTKCVAPGEARTHNPGIPHCTVYKYRALTDCATGEGGNFCPIS